MKSYPNIDFLKSTLSYCQFSGVFTWKKRAGNSKSDNIFNSLFAGKNAGSVVSSARSKTSYIAIKINGDSYKAHRLAFLLMGFELPKAVDHIDNDGTNNKWSNLRASDCFDNSRNLPMQKSNKTGVIGVNWHKSAKKWQARAVDPSGKRIDLGRYDSFDDAVAARKKHEKEFKYYKNRGGKC
jgi:hypothetical protein